MQAIHPYCGDRKVLKGYNDLRTTHPEIAREWNKERNGDLKPTNVIMFFTTTKFRISRLISFGFHRFAKVPHPFFANCPIFPSSRLPRTFCSARRTQPADHDA